MPPFGAALCAIAASGCAPASMDSTDRFAATGELVALSGAGAGAANACFACHGLAGEGDGAFTPRLARIDAGYLERQLIAYADGRRSHSQMAYIAGTLDARERRAVAAYYADLAAPPPAPRVGESALAAALYHRGDPARGLVPCAACHGEQGEGLGPANPPLAGQPGPYLAAQVALWRQSKRRSDPGDVMLRISQLLSSEESAALAVYAGARPGGRPRPESPAASLAARRGDPRSDASRPLLHVPESARARE
jgi:cytochrome c553